MWDKVAIVILSCVASTDFSDFNPHRLNANVEFVREHPEQCSASEPLILDLDVTIEQCQSRAELHFMPGWLQKPANKGRIWIGARCERHEPKDLIMGPLEQRAVAIKNGFHEGKP